MEASVSAALPFDTVAEPHANTPMPVVVLVSAIVPKLTTLPAPWMPSLTPYVSPAISALVNAALPLVIVPPDSNLTP
jgi:hypothetical protein